MLYLILFVQQISHKFGGLKQFFISIYFGSE